MVPIRALGKGKAISREFMLKEKYTTQFLRMSYSLNIDLAAVTQHLGYLI